MFRSAISVLRVIQPLRIPYYNAARIIGNEFRNYTTLNVKPNLNIPSCISKGSLINNNKLIELSNNILQIPVRSVTKFSLKKGKRKTSKAVLRRFFRLNWGGWIRTLCGRNKKMWKKTLKNKRRLRQHVFCNSSQSHLLDKMVTNYWKRPKHYVDDVYAPYHTREEFSLTRKTPKQY
ncbi:large ribosomal subunit protein bL35m [Epargyreus clarus]|uniref:large ribosomal subunit protein bL35m n=1 Tax=Epargyreus clarus TaxID=520877 RepID=UPI003C2BA8F7